MGPYEVVALLGTGGMAEVYRARDTRLGRDVALKVVSEALGADGAFLERFEREARLAGSVNHPNVVALHDVGLHDGKPYFVTELLHGETLRERLAKGPIPLGKALEWAAQMAQGLAAAHERGIVHRDLKPENTFISRDGHLKLLDFGIAKLIESAHQATPHGLLDETVSPSGSSTGTGAVLGTPGYMSPEQVRGDTVDARTDFFSLGAVLYEMLCGQRAFPSGSVVESGYAILHNEPEPLPTGVPGSVTQVVARCLEKDVGRRFQSARDLAFNLELLRNPTASTAEAMKPSSPRRWRRWWWLVPIAAVAGLIAVALSFATPVRRSSLSSVRSLTFREGQVVSSRFGPDSRTVYFSASWVGEPPQVYSTTTDNPDYHSLGIDSAVLQAVSPSGELAVLLHPRHTSLPAGASGTLARVPGVGGIPREIADDVSGADWAPDGVNMVITRETAGGFRIEYPIGNTVYESSHRLGPARLSPKGGRIAFVEYAVRNDLRGDMVVVEPGRPKRVLVENWEGLFGLAWAPEGDEVWYGGLPSGLGQQPALWAVSLRGEVRQLEAGTETEYLEDIARDGRALVIGGIWKLDIGVLNVAQKKVNAHLGWFDAPLVSALSVDGQSMLVEEGSNAGVAFGASNGGGVYWTFLQRTDGSPPVRLGPGGALDLSRDGKWALVLDKTGHPGRVWLLPTGSGTSRSIDFADLSFTSEGEFGFFLPDGKGAVVSVQRPEGVRGYVIDLESGKNRPMTPPLRCCDSAISPDRRFLAAASLAGSVAKYPTQEGSTSTFRGVQPDDVIVGWIDRGLLVVPDARRREGFTPPEPILLVDPETGNRKLFTTFEAGYAPGADLITRRAVTPDGQTLAYTYAKVRSALYLFDFHASTRDSTRQR